MGTTKMVTGFERAVAAIIAGSWWLAGLYYAGPWYIDSSDKTTTGEAPALYLLPSLFAVNVYGVVLMIAATVLLYASLKRGLSVNFFTNALLAAITIRLYHFIGTVLSYESFLPPSYLSTVAVLIIASSLWVWVRINANTT